MKNPSRSKRLTTKKHNLNVSRRYYAEELRAVADLQSESLVRAFAKVPRENFLGPGPWQVFSPGSQSDWTTKDADPSELYHNLLVVIDAERHLNNGYPSFLAFLIDELQLQPGEHVVHVGCGTGYYTAIMAEVVGSEGYVAAIEVDTQLASRARGNLNDFPNVEEIEGDGGQIDAGLLMRFLSMQVSHILAQYGWIPCDPLERLILPLTVTDDADGGGGGRVLKIIRQPEGFTASFISGVGIFSCVGGRDAELNQRLKEAFDRDDWKSVQSLRREPHEPADTLLAAR
jgi:protein-L-isoaspartate(D-aspartate) O-methyltransferase